MAAQQPFSQIWLSVSGQLPSLNCLKKILTASWHHGRHDFFGYFTQSHIIGMGRTAWFFWAFYSKSHYGSGRTAWIFLGILTQSYYESGLNCMILWHFMQGHIMGLGRTALFLGRFDRQKHCPYKRNPLYLNFLDMHIVWCGSNLESADFLLFQGHGNLLHVFLRNHWKWWVVFKTLLFKILFDIVVFAQQP